MSDDAVYQLESVTDEITRIELSPPISGYEPLVESVNVYLVEGDSPALINVGHPAQADALAAALRQCSVTPADIERIIATSWEIDVVGGAVRFPRADLFVLSPDMEAPRDFEIQIEQRRQHLRQLAVEMSEHEEDFSPRVVDELIDRFYPRMTRSLRFAPLRNGNYVQAGPLRLEVLATAGPGPGHMALYAADEELLFCGDFAMSGLPDRLDDAQAYLVSLGRLARLASKRVMPNRDRTFKQGRWTVSRAANFLNNFLSNAPAALVRAPTVYDFVERDRGLTTEEPLELLFTGELFRTLFDELVRTGAVAAEGQGLDRRYGIDVDDPREKMRKS